MVELVQDADFLADNGGPDPCGRIRSARLCHQKAAAQEIAPLAADGFNFDILPDLLPDELHGRFENVRVEGPRQSFVTGHHNQEDVVLLALRQQRVPRLARLGIVNFRPRHQRLQHICQHLSIGARSQRAILRTPELRRRDHLHGLGDLARIDHTADAPLDVENVCHSSVVGR